MKNSRSNSQQIVRASALSGIGLRLGLLIVAAMVLLAVVVTMAFSNQLERAYSDAGRQQLTGIAETWKQNFRVAGLRDTDRVQARINLLRESNKTLHKVSISWVDDLGRTAMVQSGHAHDPNGLKRDVSTQGIQVVGRGSRTPLNEGKVGYREVRAADGAHYGEIQEPVLRDGRVRAMLELHYDLKGLDLALAKSKRTAATVAILTALSLWVVVALLLRGTLLVPLSRLRAATQRLGAGDRKFRLNSTRRDEIGLLAMDFDRMAAELDRAHEHLEMLALTDPLTGLLNHRAFKERLEQELRRAEREGYPVSLVALDVDNFKEVNDRYGHAAGDAALKVLARTLRSQLRPSDICGRVGGDEFCLAIVGSDSEEAEEIVDRMRKQVMDADIGLAGQHVTISAGIAGFPRDSLGREELMHLADGAMYWSKSAGRNCSFIYSAESTFALSAEELAARAVKDGLVNTVHALAKAVDAKDGYTSMHSQRVGRYAATLAATLGLEVEAVETIRTAGVLHDVGKIGISDEILQKPEKLTDEEWLIMRRHSEFGRDIIAGAGMEEIATCVLHLHERFDGAGYPSGLAGEDIPLASRVLHAVDALEAMTSERVYRRAMSTEAALAEIERVAGTQIDPVVAEALVGLVRSGDLLVGEDEEIVEELLDGPLPLENAA